jgi:hypothetical protein
MVQTQITRIRNFDGSQTLRKHSDGSTLPYLGPNLTTIVTGITDPLYVLKRIDDNGTTEGSTYPFKYVARDQTDLPLLTLILCGTSCYQIRIDLSNSDFRDILSFSKRDIYVKT